MFSLFLRLKVKIDFEDCARFPMWSQAFGARSMHVLCMLDVNFLVYPLIICLSVQCNAIGTKLFSKAICNLDKMSSALLDQITGISQPPLSFTPLIWISCL